jgi:mRNA interferase MazF
MNVPKRGEVWIVDLGMVAKVRPALVLSIPFMDQDRALVTLIPHTTSLRGSRFEIDIAKRFLEPGAFNAQNPVTVPHAKMRKRVGVLTAEEFSKVEDAVRLWLGL